MRGYILIGMYSPIQDGIQKNAQVPIYSAVEPPKELAGLVHCFWELKSDVELSEDFHFHVLPDACVNILFNIHNTSIAGVTALNTTATTLNLGRSFHYVGIEFLPGVWQGDRSETIDSYVGEPYVGALPLVAFGQRLAGLDFASMQVVLLELLDQLVAHGQVVASPMMARILAHIDTVHTVADMAAAAHMSSRQLQRSLKQATGFTPHNLLKVLRLQQSFKRDYLEYYTDQSHFIRSFKDITGYTPAKYVEKFNV